MKETQSKYLFTSESLGFRQWRDQDISKMTSINQDEAIMRYFPGLQSEEATKTAIENFRKEYAELGYTYFAVDYLVDQEFIGFIGMHIPNFEADFLPAVDMGWRLDKKYWYKGLGTEGASRCMQFAFEERKLEHLIAIAPQINLPSISIMKKIGMKKVKTFRHPLLINYPELIDCELYEIHRRIDLKIQYI